MAELPVNLTPAGPPDTIIPAEPPEAVAALVDALSEPERKAAVAEVAARWPRFLDAWAHLGDLADDPIESYAYYRIGYHRGLDKLRASGWRGSGFVRWEHSTNHGFLRSLIGLRKAAERIGEQDEVDRIGQFITQLDPDLDY
jgi:hypothetical protein